MKMHKTEDKLKERIKELTCLYEVSSIIGDAETQELDFVFLKIANSLKEAFQFPERIDVSIEVPTTKISTSETNLATIGLESVIQVFNQPVGKVLVSYNKTELVNFLKEEQDLLDNVAMKLGNHLERIEIRESENSLRRQTQRSDRLVILGELTAGIAHELNTPLANILGFAELLKTDLKGNETALNDVEKIIQNSIFSREVVKKLMFFACEMPQEMKQLNLVPIIKESINLLDSSFRKNEIKYLVKIDQSEIALKADSIQLTQIIFNLCMNAIYFTPKNGLVTITVTESKESVIIEISDEGEGLKEENLEKVFQPFFTTKPVGDGSGLGLSVVHGIVSSHKGTIRVTNNTTKGARFTVTLPK